MQIPAVVFDNGSQMYKIGISGEDNPAFVGEAVIGRPKQKGGLEVIGHDAIRKGIMDLRYPIRHGIVQNWEDFRKVVDFMTTKQLKTTLKDRSVLMTEACRNPLANTQTIIQTMFETYKVSAFYLSNPTLLSLYSSGRTTGFVLDVGDGVTQCAAISEGCLLPQTVQRYNFGGMDLTLYMSKLINELGVHLKSTSELEIARQIKQKLSYVALHFDDECKNDKQSDNYKLPDGRIIKLDQQRFKCGEAIFNPSLINREHPAIQEVVHRTIQTCRPTTKTYMYNNIILSGGCCSMKGLPERLAKELVNLAVNKIRVMSPNNDISAWVGGSILTSLSTFQSQWITRQEYNECGVEMVHRRCLQ